MARTARPSPVDQDPLLNYPVSIATAKLSERILLGKALIQSTASPGVSNEAALENIRAKFNI